MTGGASHGAHAARVFTAVARLGQLGREYVHRWSSSARSVVADHNGRPDWLPWPALL